MWNFGFLYDIIKRNIVIKAEKPRRLIFLLLYREMK